MDGCVCICPYVCAYVCMQYFCILKALEFDRIAKGACRHGYSGLQAGDCDHPGVWTAA